MSAVFLSAVCTVEAIWCSTWQGPHLELWCQMMGLHWCWSLTNCVTMALSIYFHWPGSQKKKITFFHNRKINVNILAYRARLNSERQEHNGICKILLSPNLSHSLKKGATLIKNTFQSFPYTERQTKSVVLFIIGMLSSFSLLLLIVVLFLLLLLFFICPCLV